MARPSPRCDSSDGREKTSDGHSSQGLDHPDHVFSSIALVAGEVDQFAYLAQHGSSLARPDHGEPAASP
jgi:hypothetical protein